MLINNDRTIGPLLYTKQKAFTPVNTAKALSSSLKVDQSLNKEAIKKSLTESVSKAQNVADIKKDGVATNTLQELLKITSELEEIEKLAQTPDLTIDSQLTIDTQRRNLESKFNRLVGSDQFKKITKIMQSLAGSDLQADKLLEKIDNSIGSQGADLKHLMTAEGASSFKSLAKIFSSLEEVRIVGGEVKKLSRKSDGELNTDISAAFNSDLSISSMSSLIESGLETLSARGSAASKFEEIKEQAAESIRSFAEQINLTFYDINKKSNILFAAEQNLLFPKQLDLIA